jgi:hypothetical protein
MVKPFPKVEGAAAEGQAEEVLTPILTYGFKDDHGMVFEIPMSEPIEVLLHICNRCKSTRSVCCPFHDNFLGEEVSSILCPDCYAKKAPLKRLKKLN